MTFPIGLQAGRAEKGRDVSGIPQRGPLNHPGQKYEGEKETQQFSSLYELIVKF